MRQTKLSCCTVCAKGLFICHLHSNMVSWAGMNGRLQQQIEFIIEIDKLKSVLRQTTHFHSETFENSAEHSWHLAMMAMVLKEYANERVEIGRVIQMLLVHDLVEIYAGDTFIYDTQRTDKEEAERLAAEKLFAFLPPTQSKEFNNLWVEFEAKQTADSKFAGALDRLQPMLVNYFKGGGSWKRHGIKSHQVLDRNEKIDLGSHELWKYAQELVQKAIAEGKLAT